MPVPNESPHGFNNRVPPSDKANAINVITSKQPARHSFWFVTW